MLKLYGDHSVRLDNKGRLLFPAKLRKAMEEVIHQGLMINRNIYNKCLMLYPMPTWEQVAADLDSMNPYSRDHEDFVRHFLNGAVEVELDNVGRIKVPPRLLAYAGVDLEKDNEIIINGIGQKMELWSAHRYDEKYNNSDFDFEALADKVYKDIKRENRGGNPAGS